MAYLIEQLFGWLVIVGVLCAVSGWALHALRTNTALDDQERDRDQLRRDLVAMVNAELPQGDGELTIALEREIETLRTRAEINAARITELENHLLQARDQRDRDLGEIESLKRDLDKGQTLVAAPLPITAEISEEEQEAQRRLHWRLRYFEARAAHLQTQADRPALPAPAPEPDPALLAALAEAKARAEAAEAEIVALKGQIGPDLAPENARLADEALRMSWNVRYLQARVRYLESQEPQVQPVAAPVGPTEDELQEQRRQAWRGRYLAARVAHLEEDRAGVQGLEADLEALRRKVAELEASEITALELASQADAKAASEADRAALLAQELSARDAALNQTQAALGALPGLEARVAELTALAQRLVGERDSLAQELAALRAAPVRDPDADALRWRTRYLASRVRHLETEAAPLPAMAAPAAPAPEPEVAPLVPAGAEVRPEGMGAPRLGAPDDLRLIDGIGPKLESTLNSLGIYHFDQIAAWTPANVAWVDQYLRFRGRIVRERWVEQARAIASGQSAGRLTAADEMA